MDWLRKAIGFIVLIFCKRHVCLVHRAYLFTVLYLESIFIVNKSLLFYLMLKILYDLAESHFAYLSTAGK